MNMEGLNLSARELRLQYGEQVWDRAEEVAATIGTPAYLYFPAMARSALGTLFRGLESWGHHALAYSTKTNPYRQLLCDVKVESAWIEVVSESELTLALDVGFPGEHIVFNGPLKTATALELAVNAGCFSINIDSIEEFAALEKIICANSGTRRQGVGVRLCPPKRFDQWSRFGLDVGQGEAIEAVDRIRRNPQLRLRCVHVHGGTQVSDLEYYTKILTWVDSLWSDWGLGAETWLDLGGGFPYQHDRSLEKQAFDPVHLFGGLRSRWTSTVVPSLLIEPGRFVAAPAFCMLSRVIAVKSRTGEPSIVVLDSGTNQNVMAAFYEHTWSFNRMKNWGDFRICGPLCMEDDILSGDQKGPVPAVGSLALTSNAGAYSFSLGRSFIQPQPPVVVVEASGTLRVDIPRQEWREMYRLSRQIERRVVE